MKTLRRQSLFFMTKFYLMRMQRGVSYSKSLLELESVILNELDQFKPELKVEVAWSENLIFQLAGNGLHSNIFTRLRLFLRILKTRGQCRWLCHLLFSPARDSAYEITRARLFILIAQHWKEFSIEVLSCLSLPKEDTSPFERIDLHQFINPPNIQAFDTGSTYVLGGEYKSKLIYRKMFKLSQNSTLTRIILWKSHYAAAFIQQSSSLKDSPKLYKFLEMYPDFQELLNSRVSLDVVFHPNSEETFDQRLQNGMLPNQDKVTNVEIWHQRFIIKDKSWLVIDSTCSPRLHFVAGHWAFLEQNKLEHSKIQLLKPKDANRIRIRAAIFLMGRVDENWYHLLLDTLPRYLLFKDIDPDVPVLIRGDLPKTSILFIERLIGRKIIYVQPEDLISIETLYFISARSTVHDSLPENGEERLKYSPELIQSLRDWIHQAFPREKNHAYPVRVFFTRRSKYRNLLNVDGVSRFFEENDFVLIEPNEDFFLNQIAYFSSAKKIVSPGGALLANIIFMDKSSSLVVIRSWRGSNLRLWKMLAYACKIDYSEVVGIPSYYGFSSLKREHSNYYVPIKRIKQSLSK